MVRGRRRKSLRVNGLGPRLTKGAEDDVSLCVSTGSLACGWQKVRITIRYPRMSSDSLSLDDKGVDDDVSLCVPTGSLASGWQKVQNTTLVSACYHALGLMDSKRMFIRITTRVFLPAPLLHGLVLVEIDCAEKLLVYFRTSPDLRVKVT